MRNAPDYIQFYPTLRCNRSCEFCFNRRVPPLHDISLEMFHVVLDRLKKIGVKTIDIIGGEPTIHSDIVCLVREAAARNFYINISSNGTNLEVLEKIVKTDHDVTVGISINDPEILDHARSFIRRYPTIVKTLYSRSSDSALMTDILSLQPTKFCLLYRDAIEREDLRNSVPFPQFLNAVSTASQPRVGAVYCSGFLPGIDYAELAFTRCPAGTTKLAILPDGSVYPCNLFFSLPNFLLGNILTDSFDAIWHHRLLDFFRRFTENQCPRKTCELHLRCHGGCPAHSFLHFESLAEPDPRCMQAL